MTKSEAREIAVRFLFSEPENVDELLTEETFERFAQEDELFAEFPTAAQQKYIRTVCDLTRENLDSIDDQLEKYMQGWKLSRISKTALAILRCAVCEIEYMPEIPASVSANEAVELAKRYDGAETASFVNGILGSLIKDKAD